MLRAASSPDAGFLRACHPSALGRLERPSAAPSCPSWNRRHPSLARSSPMSGPASWQSRACTAKFAGQTTPERRQVALLRSLLQPAQHSAHDWVAHLGNEPLVHCLIVNFGLNGCFTCLGHRARYRDPAGPSILRRFNPEAPELRKKRFDMALLGFHDVHKWLNWAKDLDDLAIGGARLVFVVQSL